MKHRPVQRRPETVAKGARTVFSNGQRWILLVIFALLVAFRIPRAWTHGRFLAEEASVFLAYAWHHTWPDALLRPFAGYLNIGANATTLLVSQLVKGGVMSLERAPYLTMLIALAVQLLPAALILTGVATWLAARAAVVAALLIVVIAPGTEEVSLNVLHIQFHLALCTALILALEVPKSRRARIGYGAILFLAPLCGPGAIVFLPLIGLRGLIDRDWGRLTQCAASAAGAGLQMLLFYGKSPVRGHLLDPGTIAAMLVTRLIAMPALGFSKANAIGAAAYRSQVAGGTGWLWMIAIAVVMFGGLLMVALRRRDAAIWLLLSSLFIGAVSFGFGMIVVHRSDLFSVGAGERYNFLPLVLFGLSLVALAMRPGVHNKRLFGFSCLLLLFTGLYRYPRPVNELSQGPSWSTEVALWRQDHRHPLAVWPVPWTADLSDNSRPCRPITDDPTRSTDPLYCESGWVAANLMPPKNP